MKESVLKQVKELREEITQLDKNYEKNNEALEILKKDKKVMQCIKLLDENEKIRKKTANNIKTENMLIEHGCNHDLCLFISSECDSYEGRRYYKYRCLECGKIFEIDFRLRNGVIDKNNFDILRNEYFEYLLKYNEKDAIDIMIYKYKDNLFNELIENGVETIKALNLVKKQNIKEA